MTDEATTKHLQEALRDTKKAARAIQAAIDHEADAARLTYHRNDAIAQLEFAQSALRAAKG